MSGSPGGSFRNTESGGADRPLTLETMRADIAEMLFMSPEEVADDDDLITLGLDSVRLMTLAIRWKDAGARVSFADLAEHTELRKWWEMVSRAVS